MSEVPANYRGLIDLVRNIYGRTGVIGLHEPRFRGNEKHYLADCIDTGFVSSIGPYVDRFETAMRELTGAQAAVATVNGTAALHTALILAGAVDGDEVITQPLTFVATCNAIRYQRAHPVFVDIDRDTLSLSPTALTEFLDTNYRRNKSGCYNKNTGRRISAVVVMHTFGLPGRTDELLEICRNWGIVLIEDAAEAIGSKIDSRHSGTIGDIGVFSFNGNKTITSGGGGCLITNDASLGSRAKHLTTTAKRPHAWNFHHDEVGYNYRMPNINAALACAQLEQLDIFLEEKRSIAAQYAAYCDTASIALVQARPTTTTNHWLNGIMVSSRLDRDVLLAYSHECGVMARPAWDLMPDLAAFAQYVSGPIDNARWAWERLVTLPSSAGPTPKIPPTLR